MAREQARTQPAFAPGKRESGTRPKASFVLEHGATRIALAMGQHVIGRGEDADIVIDNERVPTRDAEDDHPADVTTRRTQAFGLMIGVIDKAIALGKPDEAERLIGTLLSDVLEEAQHGREVQPGVAEAAATAALKLARATGKSQWIEYPLRLFSAQGRLLPLEAVDDLFAVSRRAPRLDLSLLRRYIELVQALRLGPNERFVVQRLQNLANMLGAVG